MNKFKIGDRVKVIHEHEYYPSPLKNKIGVVAHFYKESDPPIGINFLENIGGHNLDGSCSYGFGYYLYEEDIELVNNCQTKDYPFEVPEWWNGKPVLCKVWEDDFVKEGYVILSLNKERPFLYREQSNGGHYTFPNAEPIIKTPSKQMTIKDIEEKLGYKIEIIGE